MERLTRNGRSSLELEQLYAEVLGSDQLKFGVSSFSAIAARRVIQFDPNELLRWLKSTAFSSIKAPNANQLLEILPSTKKGGNPPRGDLASYLTLLQVRLALETQIITAIGNTRHVFMNVDT